ncbi:SNF7 family protein [Candidatus Nitrosopumilus salaria BD31]|uniref:SNF7 family protein n=1 Tax=Candidatus Nitrosopumilus salarius BD31 TaxID=859350 RepID=I3D312_9ARCH|nr:Snf7 family protein [Candidatus Nitrosopumilus salaria]EIJ66105.1 SNF7 family protein [Candidatus Nitrosopumilus salaria BD31]
MPTFQDNWDKTQKPRLNNQIHGMIKKESPLKPRIQQSIGKLNQTFSKIDHMHKKLQEKDAKLFNRIIVAQQKHDKTTGRVLANELVELRKNEKLIGNLKLALEQIQLRLSTMNELGDAMVTFGPVMEMMRSIGPALNRFIPQADAEFEGMSNLLGGMMTDSFGGSFELDSTSNEETENILKEAAVIAGNKVGGKFPSTPSQISRDLGSRVN